MVLETQSILFHIFLLTMDNETVDKANKEIAVVDDLGYIYHRIWCLAWRGFITEL